MQREHIERIETLLERLRAETAIFAWKTHKVIWESIAEGAPDAGRFGFQEGVRQTAQGAGYGREGNVPEALIVLRCG